MPRGKASPVGTERTAQNGYIYVRVAERGWVLKHWLIAEGVLGRLIDSNVESVKFLDGNKNNFDVHNLQVTPKVNKSLRARIAALEAKISDLREKKILLEEELAREQK